jgi:hypothetical protein
MHIAIGNETVALDDVMGQIGQGATVGSGAEPQASCVISTACCERSTP